MKKRALFVIVIMILVGTNLYAANGDLTVSGDLAVGSTFVVDSATGNITGGGYVSGGHYGFCSEGYWESQYENEACSAIAPCSCVSQYGSCTCPSGFTFKNTYCIKN